MGVRVRLLIGVAVAVVVAVVLGVVFVWSGGSDDPPPAARQERPKPVLKPLRLDDRPLWTSRGVVPLSASGVDVLGGTMLVHQIGNESITAVDRGTFGARWTVTRGAEVTGDGGVWLGSSQVRGDNLLMKWEYTQDCSDGPNRGVCHESGKDRSGLVLRSAMYGTQKWAATIIPSFPEPVDLDTRPQLVLGAMSDTVALVSIGVGLRSATERNTPPASTIAVDLRTGETLWENKDGMWPLAIAGDTVLGEVRTPGSAKWTVVGADLATGERRWGHGGGLDQVHTVRTAGDVALLAGRTDGEPERDRAVFVDARTGRVRGEVARSANVAVGSCDGDGETVLACVTHDRKTYDTKVTIFRVDRHTATTVDTDYGSTLKIDAAWSGRLQLAGTPRGGGDPREFTMDSAGNVIDPNLDLPGTVVDVSDGRATIVTEDDVEVYRVSP